MINSTSRRLLGSGALAAILLPLLLNLLLRPAPEIADEVVDLGAAGPFEVSADGKPGRSISTVAKGQAFAWTFHYCIAPDLPATEVIELRRLSDGQAITRRSATVVLGADRCLASAAVQRIPIDAAPGADELTRRLAVRSGSGIVASSVMASIPIEVAP